MSENQKKPTNNETEEKVSQFLDRVSESVFSVQPYDREILEKMTPEERRIYNNGYRTIGVLCLIGALLEGVWNLITGDSQWLTLSLVIAGIGCLLYYGNPFFYANLWKSIVNVISNNHD